MVSVAVEMLIDTAEGNFVQGAKPIGQNEKCLSFFPWTCTTKIPLRSALCYCWMSLQSLIQAYSGDDDVLFLLLLGVWWYYVSL